MQKQAHDLLVKLGVDMTRASCGFITVNSPIDGTEIAHVHIQSVADIDAVVSNASAAFQEWKSIPAPLRGELIRLYGEELRKAKKDLGKLVTIEAGKILSEGLGEVQEMIDICDFAVGLSRQLYGLTIASERPGHHMRETWHPLGPVAIISAFNFPVAVWCWNAALAIICGDPVIWKPSEKTPLTALACQALFEKAQSIFRANGKTTPAKLSQVVIGMADVGEALAAHKHIPLVSATGSTRMGRAVAETVGKRLGKSLLELGGNNAMVVTPSADLDMAVRAILFGAVGTAGQRCTTLRRLIVHETIAKKLMSTLVKAYESLPIGNPLEDGTLVGPLIDADAWRAFASAVDSAKSQGGEVLTGGTRVETSGGFYVRPAIIRMNEQTDIVKHETFAPILFVMTYDTLENAIAMQNDVPQGLSSCIFTMDVREAEFFLSARGSDCGIANVNIGPSGAEIGGAFGGEKDTGGGRESGSDSWKNYMRRQTQTVNYSADLPLAQGVKFTV